MIDHLPPSASHNATKIMTYINTPTDKYQNIIVKQSYIY